MIIMGSKTIEESGPSLYSESFGSPANPPVLLIMGAMASGVWWPEDFCRQLAGRGRFVIRYDHRDTGRSTSYEPGRAAYATEDLADDALRVLDGYAIGAAHLVGMSLGGYLAQILALKSPTRVLSLTLIASERLAPADPAMPGIAPAVLEYHARAGGLDWSDRQAVVEYQVGGWRLLSGSAHPFDEAAIRALAVAAFDRSPNLLTSFNHAGLGEADRWAGRLGEIGAPALVIHGTEDPVLPYAHGLALQAELPTAELLTLEGTGHELHRADWPTILPAIARHTEPREDAPGAVG
jgi:pimeloyl-ACP methyl ester carboxylesterase